MARPEALQAIAENRPLPSPHLRLSDDKKKMLSNPERKKRVEIPEEKIEPPSASVAQRFKKAIEQTTAIVFIPVGLDSLEFRIRKIDLDEMIMAVHIPLGFQYTEETDKIPAVVQEKFEKDGEFRKVFFDRLICLCSLEPKIVEQDPTEDQILVSDLREKDKLYLIQAINLLHGWDEESRKAARPFRGEKRSSAGRSGKKVRETSHRTPEIETTGVQHERSFNAGGKEARNK